MKKITLFLAFILTLSITTIILSSCTKNTSSLISPQPTVTITSTVTAPLSSSQPTVTITSTQTMTMTATQTVPVASATPDIPQNVDKNTPRFLVGRDTYADLNLLGFYTQKDAIFVPKIPAITNVDQWILKFKIPDVNLPIVVNWGYITKSGKPDATFSFNTWGFDQFKTLYSTNQSTLINKSTADLYISTDGIHMQNINQPGEFIAFIHTNNSDDILGWWMKSGYTVKK